MRIYYYAIFGAIGGLIGWHGSNLLGLSFSDNIYLSDAISGGVIGLCLGLPLGVAEGLISRNVLRALRGAFFAGLVGLVAGVVGLPLGEWVFHLAGAGVLGRALGWGLFGLMIGLAEGITGGTQIWKGALGGGLGGAFGGVVLETASLWSENLSSGKGLGLVLLGASIGALIALIVVLLSRAWLQVTSGKLKGTTFILDKFMGQNSPSAIVGSNALKSEIVLPDPDIDPQHALLVGAGSHFTIKDMSMGGTFVNKRKIEQTRLSDRQSIRMGNTSMTYRERR
jgi:hypothetical protein